MYIFCLFTQRGLVIEVVKGNAIRSSNDPSFYPLPNTRCIKLEATGVQSEFALTTYNRIFSMAIARAPVHYC